MPVFLISRKKGGARMNGMWFAILLYLGLMVALGVIAYYRTKNMNDYMLGGRTIGPVVTALSAGASDMSGWLLMGPIVRPPSM